MSRVRLPAIMALLLGSAMVRADIAVVTHDASHAVHLSRHQVINIFMGRYRQLPDGGLALPIDLVGLKDRFYRALVDRDLAEINALRARQVFSGQGSPPYQADAPEEVAALVLQNPGALGYVDAAGVTPDQQIVFMLHE
ncbi:hypothetical protein C7446_0299 [Kushneria sinocarnis]|uniref:Phosphate ABC transporter substrate-binding protein n=1 Tax=Kushneria sinocarnis TaxID=595502 RepID=A0A420X166_9GAMM|nr:hypothetical protein [Kushneria sinocarnis]RKR07487.1 hypothetical protein C7446_0299 [Kushneria sinocarnis]